MAIEYLSFKEAMKYLGMKSPITLRAYQLLKLVNPRKSVKPILMCL